MKPLALLRVLAFARQKQLRVTMLVAGQRVRFQKIDLLVSGESASHLAGMAGVQALDQLDTITRDSTPVPPLSPGDIFLTAEGFNQEHEWVDCGLLFDAASINAIAFANDRKPPTKPKA